MRRLFWVFVALLAAVLCSAADATLTGKERSAGRKLYIAKCAKCHKFHEPKSYSDPDWGSWMSKMSRKSKLKPEEEQLLTRYLQAYRQGEIPTAK